MRNLTPTGDVMDLDSLPHYWQGVDAAFARLEQLPDLAANRVLSARSFDESQPAGVRPYIEASRYLGVAMDNHRALVALLATHGATPWAPWSLMRPIFESSFLACWILDPEDGTTRRVRGLRCEVLDAYAKRTHTDSFKNIPEVKDLIAASKLESDAGAFKTYKDEAGQLNVNWDKMHQQINMIDEFRRVSVLGDGHMVAFAEYTWRLLSGFQHGRAFASVHGSDLRTVAEIPGGVNMELTIKDDVFVSAAKVSYFLLLTGCRLFEQRHTAP